MKRRLGLQPHNLRTAAIDLADERQVRGLYEAPFRARTLALSSSDDGVGAHGVPPDDVHAQFRAVVREGARKGCHDVGADAGGSAGEGGDEGWACGQGGEGGADGGEGGHGGLERMGMGGVGGGIDKVGDVIIVVVSVESCLAEDKRSLSTESSTH